MSHLYEPLSNINLKVSSITRMKMSSSGSTKKIILDLFQWKRVMMSRALSHDLLDSLKLFKVKKFPTSRFDPTTFRI